MHASNICLLPYVQLAVNSWDILYWLSLPNFSWEPTTRTKRKGIFYKLGGVGWWGEGCSEQAVNILSFAVRQFHGLCILKLTFKSSDDLHCAWLGSNRICISRMCWLCHNITQSYDDEVSGISSTLFTLVSSVWEALNSARNWRASSLANLASSWAAISSIRAVLSSFLCKWRYDQNEMHLACLMDKWASQFLIILCAAFNVSQRIANSWIFTEGTRIKCASNCDVSR